VKGVAVHWTVTPARADHAQCEADWQGVIAQHDRAGYRPSPAYNWGACQHGIRMEGRTWAIKSAANGTTEANRDYWAVVALNAPGDTPSPELLATLAALIDEAPDLESRTVRPHSDFFATACCGDELRAWVAAGAQAPNSSLQEDRMKPGLFASDGRVYVYDGNNHTKTWLQTPDALAAWQALAALNGISGTISENDTTRILLADAVDVRAIPAQAGGGAAVPLTVKLTGTATPA
jgi:hypothetical protein